MAICDPNTCTTELPDKGETCFPTRRQGGINKLRFRTCGETFDYTNASAWEAAVDNGTAWMVGIMAELGEPSDSKVQTDACADEELTGRVWTVAGKDFDMTGTTDDGPPVVFTDSTAQFWNDVQAKCRGLHFFFDTCEGKTYGPFYPPTVIVGLMVPATNKELQHIPVKVSWNDKNIPVGFIVS